jgi:hypothetical protein
MENKPHDPLGILAGAEKMSEVRQTVFTDPKLREVYRKTNQAIETFHAHVGVFMAKGLGSRNARRSAAKAMGLTLKKVQLLIDNRNKIDQIMGGDDAEIDPA